VGKGREGVSFGGGFSTRYGWSEKHGVSDGKIENWKGNCEGVRFFWYRGERNEDCPRERSVYVRGVEARNRSGRSENEGAP